jgi:hypothetical protein
MDPTTDDAELARREHENMIDALCRVCREVDGADVALVGGVARVLTGLPIRLFNQVLVADGTATPGALGAAIGAARDRGDRYLVSLRDGVDDRFRGVLAGLGLVPMADGPWMPGMALHPVADHAASPVPAGHEIRLVTDAAGMEAHRRVVMAGFGMPEDWVRAILPDHLAGSPGLAVYVGYSDGEPVTSGLGVVTGRTVGVYNIATVETARRRGLGAAMTERIAVDGAAAGCDTAILQASDMGRPIYERLGYRTVVEYVGFIDPLSPEDAEAAEA